jgi:hypothetical protein
MVVVVTTGLYERAIDDDGRSSRMAQHGAGENASVVVYAKWCFPT